MNEYLAIDSGGHVSDLVFARNCSIARMLRVGVGMNRSAREGKSVKRFERSNGPDIALYKKLPFTIVIIHYNKQNKTIEQLTQMAHDSNYWRNIVRRVVLQK